MLIDKVKLEKILQDFHIISGVRIAVFDEWHREIASYPPTMCTYCKQRRMDEGFDKLCKASDKRALETALNTRSQYTYQCHAGLYESVCPLIADNTVIGFLMIGQFVIDDASSKERTRLMYGEDVKPIRSENVRVITSIMSLCAEYLYLSRTVNVSRSGYRERAKQYVNEHLGSAITVKDVAQVLGISRTSVQALFKKHFGKGVIAYVNDQKMELAKKMIVEHRTTLEIIEAINISDPNYFYRMFKKHVGMSVSEFKEFERGFAENVENTRLKENEL